ncbi:transcription elongation factor GreA [Reticulibacter mediterranei]|uniref:Transcription elongation factor GreA n=1 Tax=Reticulibacter mediterranei TaxID=2778369 RepID=A0A8J3N168_9CHLR|nr:transcription elongation factor GreA [Reticulibacter mediterranei]GHO92273.1 transcription elongation factor GreA [Reticulibacter mediterranei]
MDMQFLTNEGQQRALSQLEFLRTVKRAEIAQYLREAVEAGDVTRNAAFDDAKFEQAQLEKRIAELEQLLANAQIVDVEQVATEVVSVGSVVHLAAENGSTRQYTIVGSYEADPGAGRISHESPVGKALLGRRASDYIIISTPGGVKTYTIIRVE